MRFRFVVPMLAAIALHSAEPAKPRVFLAGAEPERISGEALVGQSRGEFELARSAPSYDIAAMQTFTRQCTGVVVTTRRDKADIVIRIEREEPSPIMPFVKGNKIAVFNLNDELVYATRARRLTNASKDACRAILDYLKR